MSNAWAESAEQFKARTRFRSETDRCDEIRNAALRKHFPFVTDFDRMNVNELVQTAILLELQAKR